MKFEAKTFAELVSARLEQLGQTPFAVEQAHGLPPDAIRNVMRSSVKSGPRFDRVQEICDVLGLELSISLPEQAGQEESRYDWRGFAEAQLSIEGRPEALAQGYAPIPYLEDAGGYNNISPFAVSRAWSEGEGFDFDQLCVLRVLEGQQIDDLLVGDRVIVDRRPDPKFDGRVFVFFNSLMGGAELARLEQSPSGKLVGLRGPAAGSRIIELRAGARIIGPVVGLMRFGDVRSDQ